MSAFAAIHTGLRQLGIAEDDARDIYERQTGKRSLRDMTPREHEAVIGELRRLGFTPASKGSRKRLEGRFAKKLQALWIAGWNLGVVRERDDSALVAFVRRQTGIDHVRFLHDANDARKAIEAIKGWLARPVDKGGAGVDWSPEAFGRACPDGLRIAWAQYLILEPRSTWMGNRADFQRAIDRVFGPKDVDLTQLNAFDWQTVMNAFGARIRKGKA